MCKILPFCIRALQCALQQHHLSLLRSNQGRTTSSGAISSISSVIWVQRERVTLWSLMDKIDDFNKPLSIDLSMNEFIATARSTFSACFLTRYAPTRSAHSHLCDSPRFQWPVRLSTSLKDEARRPVCLLASNKTLRYLDIIRNPLLTARPWAREFTHSVPSFKTGATFELLESLK